MNMTEWKSEYAQAIESHNQTLDELNKAYAHISMLQTILKRCQNVLKNVEPMENYDPESILNLQDAIFDILIDTKA